jgi:hypothetical protein
MNEASKSSIMRPSLGVYIQRRSSICRSASSEGEGETLEPAALTGATALTLYLNATKRFPVPLDSWVIQTPPYPMRAEALC